MFGLSNLAFRGGREVCEAAFDEVGRCEYGVSCSFRCLDGDLASGEVAEDDVGGGLGVDRGAAGDFFVFPDVP